MIADGEAMALVADELDEMENRRAAVEDDGLVFVAVEIDNFFALGDGGQWLAGETERFEGFGGGVELAQAAVDEDEGWEGLRLLLASGLGCGRGRQFRGGFRRASLRG